MVAYSAARLRKTVAAEDTSLFLECWNCDATSIDSAHAHLDGDDPDLHALIIPAKRNLPASSRSERALLDVLADALANEDNRGHLHFECADCDSLNRVDGLTIGPLANLDRAVYASGSRPYPGDERVPLQVEPDRFVCAVCGFETDPETAHTEGPDAPELGWEYYECPDCDHRTGLAGVEV